MEKANWNLDDIVTLDQFDELYSETEKLINEFSDIFGRMNPSMPKEDFVEFTEHYEKTLENLHRLSARPALMESADQKDVLASKFKNKVNDIELMFNDATQKISLWLKGEKVQDKNVLDDENAKRLFSSVPDLAYSYSYSRMMGKYSLDEKSENIMTAKDINGIRVVMDLIEMFETSFKFNFRPEGRKPIIIDNSAELSNYVYSANPEIRRSAYEARFEQYSGNIEKFFVAYQAIVKDWNYEAKIRGFDSPISMRNVANHVDDKPVSTLIEVCSENIGVFQEHFKYKAKELGMSKLTRFDLFAPLGDERKRYTYDEALLLVDESFRKFSSSFADKAKEVIKAGHIDSHPSDSKRGGGFCMTLSPSVTPYILLNFTGKIDDVNALAHELGHAVHSLYANSHNVSTQNATLPLAETASTLGELLLFENILSNESNKETKKEILSHKMADSYAAICRQNYIVKFENDAHEAIQKGIDETALSKIWIDNLKEQFGDSVEIDEMFRHEWAYIRHIFHRPFYCYAYNFGELLSMALYAKYKQEGESFVPKIEAILSAGGSEDPKLILQNVGIDMSSPEFWQGSFELIKAWQRELEQL
jgi:oligoendopeptidase F